MFWRSPCPLLPKRPKGRAQPEVTMSKMEEIQLPLAACAIEADFDLSTAPTTPDGSLTFSPVLQALKLKEALDDSRPTSKSTRSNEGSDAALNPDDGQVRNVCCIGAGYVGGPTAAMIALQNPHLKVTVVDRDPIRIKQWNSKHLPIHEPGLENVIRITRDGTKSFSVSNLPLSNDHSVKSKNRETRKDIAISTRSPNLIFSTKVARNISEADIIFISVNTPTKRSGIGANKATDMTAVEAVTREIAIHAKEGAIIVEKSTVPCRTADMICSILKSHRPNTTFEILSNPEFLSEGTSISNLLTPSRILIGSSPTPTGHRAASLLSSLYESWVPKAKIITTNTYSSELSKLVSNAFLAQRISSINSISLLCSATGASISEVSASVGMDPRIGSSFLKAGVGFGGSCFGKDVRSLVYISECLGLPEVGVYWGQVLAMNKFQKGAFVRRVVGCLNGGLRGKRVAVLGVAFKGETRDMRESPSWGVLEMLVDEEPGAITVWDPMCEVGEVKEEIERVLGEKVLTERGGRIEVLGDVYEATRECDAVIIMVDSPEFRLSGSGDSSNEKLREKGFIDPRPFHHLEPTESELLALHDFFVSTSNTDDPLNRFEEVPECDKGCEICASEVKKVGLAKGNRGEKLDWARIIYHLRSPKWIFDGRGVLDRGEIERLGGRLETIGEVGWGGR